MSRGKKGRRFDLGTEMRLRLAGWYNGRNVWNSLQLPNGFTLFPAAKLVLTEFGSLQFSSSGGITVINPKCGEEIISEIEEYARLVGRDIYPIAYTDGGDSIYTLLDATGIVYSLAGWMEPLASSFDVALIYLSRVFTVNQREQHDDLKAIGIAGMSWRL